MGNEYDVIVVGGGPGGSTCATMLARAGRRVLLLERDKFPRFHIGESLTAFAPSSLMKLGVYDQLKSINYVEKRGLEFVHTDKRIPVYFPEDLTHEEGQRPWTPQMRRADFDEVLLRNAEKSGVIVKEQHAVRYEDKSGNGDGMQVTATAPWTIDATGQAGLINRQLKENIYNDPVLDDKISIFSHWEGDIGIINGDGELNFKLCVHPNGVDWAWFLPVGQNLVSIGIVVDKQSVKNRNRDLETFFNDYAKDIPFIKDFFQNPTLKRVEKFRGVKDFSYRCKSYYGKGWALTGDSAGFLDPIFSTGLQITFNSAFKVAEVIDKALKPDAQPLEELFADYTRTLTRVYRVNATLVYLFYRFGIDPTKVRNRINLVTRTQWANWRLRLKFIWIGVRMFLFQSQRTRQLWGREVLFGNPSKENLVADAMFLLAQNFETLYWRKMQNPIAKSEFNEMG